MDPEVVSELQALYRTIAGSLHCLDSQVDQVLDRSKKLLDVSDSSSISFLVGEISIMSTRLAAAQSALWKYREELGA